MVTYKTDKNMKNINNLDEELIKAYIGDKSEEMYAKLNKCSLNWWAIGLNDIYFAYRKMYLIAFLTFIISKVSEQFLPSFSFLIPNFIGIFFYPLYNFDIKRKIKKIKRKNPNATNEQLLEIVKQKGGTSKIGAIIFIVIYFLEAFIIVYDLMINKMNLLGKI